MNTSPVKQTGRCCRPVCWLLPAVSAAAATAVSATAAAATTAAAAATTTAGTAAGLVLRSVAAQPAPAEVLAVDGLDRAGSVRAVHLDEAEAAGAAGLAIARQGNRLDRAVGCEQRADLVLGGIERQIADINLGHVTLLSMTVMDKWQGNG